MLNDKPYNAETVVETIPDHYITPLEQWYVRNHHPVPPNTADNSAIQIISTTIGDLKKLPQTTMIVTLQCAGNRRGDFEKQTHGLQWSGGAISTGKFTGVLLSDIISHFNLSTDYKHVQFNGSNAPYDSSVPVNQSKSILIAYEMNHKDIPLDHGFPLRVVVPGHIAARSVKWLQKIVFSQQEAGSVWQSGYQYKLLPSSIDDLKQISNPMQYTSAQELPVQSYICRINGSKIEGYAIGGGGRNIVRVEVSFDNGTEWHETTLKQGSDQPYGEGWAWTFWEYYTDDVLQHNTVMCRAVDIANNVQPSHSTQTWSLRGILNNSYHRRDLRAL